MSDGNARSCRIADVAFSYIYALTWMLSATAGIVNSASHPARARRIGAPCARRLYGVTPWDEWPRRFPGAHSPMDVLAIRVRNVLGKDDQVRSSSLRTRLSDRRENYETCGLVGQVGAVAERSGMHFTATRSGRQRTVNWSRAEIELPGGAVHKGRLVDANLLAAWIPRMKH